MPKKEKKQEKGMRVERHIIKNSQVLDDLCFKSKNLYNLANFYVRQAFIIVNKDNLTDENKEFLLKMNNEIDKYNEFKSIPKIDKKTGEMRTPSIRPYLDKKNSYLNYHFIDWMFKYSSLIDSEENPYRSLPAATSQQILKLLESDWKSFFESIKEWSKDKSKFKGRPKLPNYKHKEKGRGLVIFAGGNQVKIKDGYIQFPNRIPFKIKTTIKDKLQQVRVVPESGHHVVEVVYKKQIEENKKLDENNRYLGIDLGVNNLMTVTNNVELKPFIINGKIIKSINQYYNKKKAEAMSFVGDKGTSNRIKRLNLKRNNKISDQIHKATRYIIDYCLENQINKIVIGYNKGWKQEVEMGRINNQKFVGIPFSKVLQQLEYKGEEHGVEVIQVKEGYTSKCDALSLEKIGKQKTYMGNRKHRGLFTSGTGRMVNADINGSLNILRKHIGDEFINNIKYLTPHIVNV